MGRPAHTLAVSLHQHDQGPTAVRVGRARGGGLRGVLKDGAVCCVIFF